MRLFLSYARSDGAFVNPLSEDLQRAGHDVWLDTEDIPGGSAWRRSIGEGIAGADVVIVVVTPDSMASPNVEREVTVADEAGKRFLPVQVAPATIPPALSFVLAGVQHIDFTDRPYEEALERLLSALSDVPASTGRPASRPTNRATNRPTVEAHSPLDAPPLDRRRSPRRERGPTRLQLGIALGVVVAIAAFLSGMLIATRRTDPLAIGQFQRSPDCSGVIVVTGVVPKGGNSKQSVKNRIQDTAAALQQTGLQDRASYLDGDTSCFAAPGNWLIAAGPFATTQQALQVCGAIRQTGEFARNPSIGLSIRTTRQSVSCG